MERGSIDMKESAVRNFIKEYRMTHKIVSEHYLPKNIVNYILQKYSYDFPKPSFNESLYRFENNIEQRPKCIICGKPVSFSASNKKFNLHCSKKCRMNDKNIKDKIKNTNKKKYGCENPFQNAEVKEKIKRTNKEKYGCENPQQNKSIKEKTKQTSKERYGVEYYFTKTEVQEKRKQTNLKKYGGESSLCSQEVQNKKNQTNLERYGSLMPINQREPSIINKIQETKLKNHTFNVSHPEENAYEKLKEVFGEENVLRQYKSEFYPFACDFYIKSMDLYIELNFHWTHGGHPFDKNNPNDVFKLNHWKIKNTKFYDKAIEVWTQRDPLKIKTAKENNINYKVFYSNEDFQNYIKNLNGKAK